MPYWNAFTRLATFTMISFIITRLRNMLVLEQSLSGEVKRALEKTTQSEERLNLALDSAQMGAWDLDIINDISTRSLRHDQIFGYSTLQPEWSVKIFLQHLFPDDQETFTRSFQKAYETNNFNIECRIIWPDKSLHWIAIHGHIYRNDKGEPTRMLGTIVNIDERKIAQDEIKKKTEELEQKNAKLRKLDLLKDDFVNNISHELRTPMTIIKESIDLVYDSTLGPITAKQKDFLETAKSNVDRLSRMINNVLDYQKFEAQKMVSNTYEGNINDTVKKVGEGFKTPLMNKGLRLEFKLAPDLPLFKFDNDQMIQVLTNLINNAMKFTSTGTIYLMTQKEGSNAIRISVKDEGIGLKAEDLNILFEPFSQIATTGYQVGGTGLGLALCKKIVESHKGRIGVESEFGHGSTFYFILPILERRVKD
jgi:signal transduction histidine kinase